MMAGFWEVTRDRSDYRVVQPLKKGIAYTVITAVEQVDLGVVPVGIYYGCEPEDYERPDVPGRSSPQVLIGMPVPVKARAAAELVDLVHPAMQGCLDVSVARSAAGAA